MEIALSKYLGPRDVVTRISRPDENIRKELGYEGPRNCSLPYRKYLPSDWVNLILKQKKAVYYNHMPALDMRHYVGMDIWNNYFKFCFERNPWDKVRSYYDCRSRRGPLPPFSEVLIPRRLRRLQRTGGAKLYAPMGTPLVDKIYRYEDMDNALLDIGERLNLPDQLKLPWAKSQFRKDTRDAGALLAKNSLKQIKKIFAAEFRLLGYENMAQ